jgi:putative spermidine/putrescine transport system permease protein
MSLLVILAAITFTVFLQSLGYLPTYGMHNISLDSYIEICSNPAFLTSIALSLYIAFASSGISIFLGVSLSWCFVLTGLARRFFNTFSKIPIIVPYGIAALLMLNIFSATGLIEKVCVAFGIDEGIPFLSQLFFMPNSFGIILSYVWKETPFVVFMVVTAMARIDTGLGEASESMGASQSQTFFHVILPACRGAIMTAFIIICIYNFGAYEIPYLLGATLPKALPVLSYIEYINPDYIGHRPVVMAVNMIMVLVSLAITFMFYRLGNMKKGSRK